MKARNIGMAAAMAGLLTLGGVASAQPHHGAWEHGGMEFLHGVTLTDAQKAQIKEIEKASWASLKPLMEQARALHEQETNTFLTAGSVNADNLQPTVEKEEALRTQIDTARMNTMLQIRGVLTPEQIAQAATVHAQLEALHAQEHAVMAPAAEEHE